jgi:hypothetical protein
MAYESLTSNAAVDTNKDVLYPAYAETDAGTVLVDGGMFTRSVERDGNFGKQITHYFDCGANDVGLNGTGFLNSVLASAVESGKIVPGQTKLQIIYLGKEKLENGARAGAMAHAFDIKIDNSLA